MDTGGRQIHSGLKAAEDLFNAVPATIDLQSGPGRTDAVADKGKEALVAQGFVNRVEVSLQSRPVPWSSLRFFEKRILCRFPEGLAVLPVPFPLNQLFLKNLGSQGGILVREFR